MEYLLIRENFVCMLESAKGAVKGFTQENWAADKEVVGNKATNLKDETDHFDKESDCEGDGNDNIISAKYIVAKFLCCLNGIRSGHIHDANIKKLLNNVSWQNMLDTYIKIKMHRIKFSNVSYIPQPHISACIRKLCILYLTVIAPADTTLKTILDFVIEYYAALVKQSLHYDALHKHLKAIPTTPVVTSVLRFANDTPYKARLYWVSYHGDAVKYESVLQPGHWMDMNSYENHHFYCILHKEFKQLAHLNGSLVFAAPPIYDQIGEDGETKRTVIHLTSPVRSLKQLCLSRVACGLDAALAIPVLIDELPRHLLLSLCNMHGRYHAYSEVPLWDHAASPSLQHTD